MQILHPGKVSIIISKVGFTLTIEKLCNLPKNYLSYAAIWFHVIRNLEIRLFNPEKNYYIWELKRVKQHLKSSILDKKLLEMNLLSPQSKVNILNGSPFLCFELLIVENECTATRKLVLIQWKSTQG